MNKNINYVHGKYFFGNEISEYGQENGYVDYGTLAKAFDAVLNNNIMEITRDIGYWETESGSDIYYEYDGDTYTEEELSEKLDDLKEQLDELDEEENAEECERIEAEIEEIEESLNNPCYEEIYQYFIISTAGAEILKDYTNEIVFYNEVLDMYVWGVTHWGTAWSYVLTDIRCNVPYEEGEF